MICKTCNLSFPGYAAHINTGGSNFHHLSCYMPTLRERILKEIADEKAAAEAAVAEAAAEAVRAKVGSLPRCVRCRTRMANDLPREVMQSFGLRMPSSGVQGVCVSCVQEEARVRALTTPPPNYFNHLHAPAAAPKTPPVPDTRGLTEQEIKDRELVRRAAGGIAIELD